MKKLIGSLTSATILCSISSALTTTPVLAGNPKYDPETVIMRENFEAAWRVGHPVQSADDVQRDGMEWSCVRRDATTPMRPNMIGNSPNYDAPTAADSHQQAIRFRQPGGILQQRVFDATFLEEGYDPIVGSLTLSQQGMSGPYTHVILNTKLRWAGVPGTYKRIFMWGADGESLVFEDVLTVPLTAHQKLYVSAPQAITSPAQLATGYGSCVLAPETPKFKRAVLDGVTNLTSNRVPWVWDAENQVWRRPHNGCQDPDCRIDIQWLARDAQRQALANCETQRASLPNAGVCSAVVEASGMTGWGWGHPYARAKWTVKYDVPVE